MIPRASLYVPFAALVLALAPSADGATAKKGGATSAPAADVHATPAVPFITDDYDAALAEAKKRNVPLFVDSWAKWCHTCRSMKAFVFTDPSLAPRGDQFVWLYMDVENAKNANAVAKYPANALPTFVIVDPATEKVARKWVGSMTLPQLQGFLDEGRAVVSGGDLTPGVASTDGQAALAAADRAYGDGDYKKAAGLYTDALPLVAPVSEAYPRVVEAAMYSYLTTDDVTRGLALAQSALPRLGRTTSGLSVASSGLSLALELPADAPERAATIARYETATKDLLSDPSIALADDDRSSILASLMEARQDAKDEEGAHDAAQAWSDFLEDAATRAKSPEERAVYDSHRLSAWIELGTPEKAIPMLEASAKAMPNDYNPPARLAIAYNAMKQWDQAIAATDRALPLAYGSRKLRIYGARSDAFKGKGDTANAVKALDEGIAYGGSLPEAQRSKGLIDMLAGKKKSLTSVAGGETAAK